MDKEIIIEYLLLRRLQGLTTPKENEFIEKWAARAPENQAVLNRLDSKEELREDLRELFSLIDNEEGNKRLKRMKARIQETTNTSLSTQKRITKWIPYVAAAVIILWATSWFFHRNQIITYPSQLSNQKNEKKSTGKHAILQLADGRSIELDENQKRIFLNEGKVFYENGLSLSTLTEGEDELEEGNSEPSLLALSTPKGGTYEITLSDGTKVWLNSASTLRYPSRFNAESRVVELEGEAFFEVISTPNKQIPFLVKTSQQTVEVLGTQFNVSAYKEEQEAKTTLLEGSVRVGLSSNLKNSMQNSPASVTIKPGQQATSNGESIEIATVNTEQFTAWKNGLFYFKHTPLEEVMKEISRWYDVEVIYHGIIPKETFSGKIDRNVSLMGLLSILQSSAINVKLEGNELIIAPQKN